MSLKHILYVISPVVAGFIFSILSKAFLNQSILLSIIFSSIFLVYWFYVGTEFYDLYSNIFITIVTGNLFFLLNLILFFLIPFTETKNVILVSIYNFFRTTTVMFLPFATYIYNLFSKKYTSFTNTSRYANDQNVIFIFVIVVLVFVFGYFIARNHSKRGKYVLDKKLFR